MPRSLVLANGNILVGMDKDIRVRDFYFPFVGSENHVGGGFFHDVGVWVDGSLHWISSDSWNIHIDYSPDSLIGTSTAVNDRLRIRVQFTDAVYNEKNIFIRNVSVTNTAKEKRDIKLFFYHQFEIYESHRGDTAYFDPRDDVIVHYKGRRNFIINGRADDKKFDEYTIGVFGIEGKEGSYKDAEDGSLTKNPIEHGRVDSTIGFTLDLTGNETKTVNYWITVAKEFQEAKDLDDYVLKKTPEHLIKTTRDYWYAWINKHEINFCDLDTEAITLFKKSLLIIHSHFSKNGSVIASSDSDMLQYGRDTYGYVWPRDGAFCALALNKAGDTHTARKFFEFCADVISEDGYLMHKYRPDKSLGSSWHPWVRNNEMKLPIQEDETAIVLYALWEHYETEKDLEFIEHIYNPFIKKAADFMLTYRDPETGLPRASYDLWEEKHGIATYTAAATYGAFTAAMNFAKVLGKETDERAYQEAAEQLKKTITNLLYDSDNRYFYKRINFVNNDIEYDATIDISSVYGIFFFDVLPIHDERIRLSIESIERVLRSETESSEGVARYEGDNYYRASKEIPGNPWIIATLWLAKYYIASAEYASDLERAKSIIDWVRRVALPSGVLPEQVHPYRNEQLSAAPLSWSHAEYILTIFAYLDKLHELGLCEKKHK